MSASVAGTVIMSAPLDKDSIMRDCSLSSKVAPPPFGTALLEPGKPTAGQVKGDDNQ
jgi:hypothetical protein